MQAKRRIPSGDGGLSQRSHKLQTLDCHPEHSAGSAFCRLRPQSKPQHRRTMPPLTLHRLTDSTDPRFTPLLDLYTAAFPPEERKSAAELRTMLRRSDYRFLLAQQNDEVLGLAVLFCSETTAIALLEYLADPARSTWPRHRPLALRAGRRGHRHHPTPLADRSRIRPGHHRRPARTPSPQAVLPLPRRPRDHRPSLPHATGKHRAATAPGAHASRPARTGHRLPR